jgi:hypothetical protein
MLVGNRDTVSAGHILVQRQALHDADEGGYVARQRVE